MIPDLRLVLAQHPLWSSRFVLGAGPDRYEVISLRSNRFDKQVHEYGVMRLKSFDLSSRSYSQGNRMVQFLIKGQAPGESLITKDLNYNSRTPFGDITVTSTVAFGPEPHRSLLHQANPGSAYRVVALRPSRFHVDNWGNGGGFGGSGFANPTAKRPKPPNKNYYLALDEMLAGRHKLVIREAGKVVRIEPLQSRSLSRTVQLHRQLTDSAEKKLTLPHSEFHRYVFQSSAKGGHLTELQLGGLGFEQADFLTQLAELPHLDSLTIWRSKLAPGALRPFRQLRHLGLGPGLSHDLIPTPAEFPNLEELSVVVTDAASFWKAGIHRHQNLKSLRISTARSIKHTVSAPPTRPRIPTSFCMALAAPPHFGTLHAEGFRLEPDAVDALSAAARIHQLSCPDADVPASLRLLKAHPECRYLNVDGLSYSHNLGLEVSRMTYGIAASLQDGLPIRAVSFDNNCGVANEHLRSFEKWNVTTLGLQGSSISDEGLAHIAGSDLTTLDIRHCQNLTPNCIESLKQCKKLKSVKSGGTALSQKLLIESLPGLMN